MSPAPDGATPDVLLRPARPDDLDWVVARHGELYEQEYDWDARFEALVAEVVAAYAAEHDSVREAAWVAELDGRRAGCVFCVTKDDTTAQLRLLLVEPFARGLGIGAAWSTSACGSREVPATTPSSCGPTTCWCRRGGSTKRRASN